eukprot:TRINITY_DN4978_c0_g1_i2.p1 TRINITY_DN4978_c0_g1~~TRINITY_DN4978_c0_g1_i2.p1  ORF type:complete len:699 (+),score=110.08 TRINITY_DN4978_c0_g1_i2:27-2123(+)
MTAEVAGGAARVVADIVSTVGSGAAAAGATLAVGIAYRAVRPLFNITVNCHFCNENSKVKYNDRNRWYCPYCGQYNGFTEDGDYNQTQHIFSSTPKQKYAASSHAKKSGKKASNGLCKNCNLHQELKMNQIASFTGDDQSLEEYIAHLERVYKLCAVCEEVVSEKLGEQNAILTPGLLEHKLETSRLAATGHRNAQRRSMLGRALGGLFHVEFVIAVIVLTVQMMQNVKYKYMEHLPVNLQVALNHASKFMPEHQETMIFGLVGVLALLGLIMARISPIHVLNMTPLALTLAKVNPYWRIAATLVTILITSVIHTRARRRSEAQMNSSTRHVNDTLSSKLIALDNSDDLDETLTSKDSINSSASNYHNKQANKSQTIGLFTKLKDFANNMNNNAKNSKGMLSNNRVHSPLIWSGDQDTLNHEFVVQSPPPPARECDLSVLNLGGGAVRGGDVSGRRTVSPAPFSHRVYSPQPNPEGIRFTPSRPIIRPPQLTSWVAGGYWSPPETKVFGETLSRSSSQSSGFVSTGLVSGSPSVENLSQLSNLPPNHVSLPTSPRNSILGDFDRNSVLSAPIMKRSNGFSGNQSFITQRRHTTEDQLSDSSVGRLSQIELSKLMPPAAQSSPNCSVNQLPASPATTITPTPSQAAMSGGDFPQNHQLSVSPKSWYDRLSFTVTVTPVGFILAASLTINLALMYFSWTK